MRPKLSHQPPSVLPAGWSQRSQRPHGVYSVLYDGPRGLRVLVSGAVMADRRRWLHVSVSHRDRLPSWYELRAVKDIFVGRDRKAIQVLPTSERYVNLCKTCLHLFSCLDGDPIPDFDCDGML